MWWDWATRDATVRHAQQKVYLMFPSNKDFHAMSVL